MKKIYLLAIAAVVSSAAFSQVKWGVQATGNLSNVSLKIEGAEYLKKTAIPGFGVGVVSDVALGKTLSLRSSLNLLQKGVKINTPLDLGDGDIIPHVEMQNKFYYAELPVNLVFNVSMSSGKLYFGAGPSVGYGLFGKSKVTYENPLNGGEKETEEADAFKKQDGEAAPFKRFDLSANAIAGYQWNSGLYVNAGYLLGLNSQVDSEDGETYKNRGLQLTVGYFFSQKK